MSVDSNRYVTDQVSFLIEIFQSDLSNYEERSRERENESERSELQSMIILLSNSLITTQLQEIQIKGTINFRFNDDLIGFFVEGLIKSQISLVSLSLSHHRINDIGFIQLCRLILVSLIHYSSYFFDFLSLDLSLVLDCSFFFPCLLSFSLFLSY